MWRLRKHYVIVIASHFLILPWLFLNLSRSTYSVSQRQQQNRQDTKQIYTPSCFLPNRSRTEVLVASGHHDNARRDWNIVNLGMPKVGSTSLYEFFLCSKITANHWRVKSNDTVVFIGECMREAYYDGIYDLIQNCSYGARALTQIDVALAPERCVIPQIHYSKALTSNEKTIFILPFRPLNDWMASLSNQKRSDGSSLLDRLKDCLPENLADVWCNHVTTIRQLVPDRLLELDLTDHSWTATMLSQFYHTKATCWTQSNRQRTKQSPWSRAFGA